MGKKGKRGKPPSRAQVQDDDMASARDAIDEFNDQHDRVMITEDAPLGLASDSDDEEEVLAIDQPDSDDMEDSDDGDEEDSDDEGDEDDDGAAAWGGRKKSYYQMGTEEVEGEEDEDDMDEEEKAHRLEEQEALKMQRQKLQKLADTDIDDSLKSILEEKARAKATKLTTKGKRDIAALDDVNRVLDSADLDGHVDGSQLQTLADSVSELTQEERLAIVKRDSPELLQLLDDFNTTVADLKDRLLPVHDKVSSGEYKNADGVSLLDAKTHLLLSYSMNLSFYLLLKVRGQQVRDHPVINQLIKVRTYLEKLRPIEKRIGYQMDRLIKAAASGKAPDAGDGGRTHRPNIDDLMGDEVDGSGEDDVPVEKDGIYRPPRLAPVSFEDDEASAVKAKRALAKEKARARQSEMVQMIKETFSDAPEQIRDGGGENSRAAKKLAEHDEEVRRYEEDNFLRMSQTKEDKKRRKKLKQNSLNPDLERLDNFGEFSAMSGEGAEEAANAEERAKQNAYASFLNEMAQQAKGREKHESGEQDLPLRDLQKEKVAKIKAEKKAARLAREEEERRAAEDAAREAIEPEENEEYDAAVAAAAAKKAARKEARKRVREVDEDDVVNTDVVKRAASTKILANRGLKKYRKKEDRNVRVKKKKQFEKAVRKRKSTVQDVKKKSTSYGGEETGIKSRTVKSTPLQ